MRNYSYSVLFFIPFMLFLVLAFAKSSLAADPNDFRKPNQWQRERTINDAINKSSVKVEAQKTYPVSTLGPDGKPIKQIRNAKATITLGAKTANVGKSLFKRAPAIAITQAVIAILGKSVDWILDEQNNAVKYIEQAGVEHIDGIAYQAQYNATRWFKTKELACRDAVSKLNADGGPFTYVKHTTDGYCHYKEAPGNWDFKIPYLTMTVNEEYPYPPVELSIPMPQVAQKLMDQAQNGDPIAMQVMNDAALDALEAGLLDAQLDAASNVPQPDPQEITQAQYDNPDYPEVGTGSGTGPETPVDPEMPTDPETPTNPEAKPFELPPFCSWASKVCDFIDWVKTEPPEPPESGEADVQIPDSNMHEGILERLYIDMPAQCPPDPVLEFMGARIPFPMSVFCQFAAMMKPLILLFAYIKGLSIIGTGLS